MLWPSSVCSVLSAVLAAPDVQHPCAILAQGALGSSSGWQRGAAGPSALFLLLEAWQRLWWWLNGLLEGMFVEQ